MKFECHNVLRVHKNTFKCLVSVLKIGIFVLNAYKFNPRRFMVFHVDIAPRQLISVEALRIRFRNIFHQMGVHEPCDGPINLVEWSI